MNYDNWKARCSSLAKIIPQCKESITKKQLTTISKLEAMESLTTKQKTELTKLKKKRDNPPVFDLSIGAKTYIRRIVKEDVLIYKKHVSTRATDKGTICEQDAIDLYNFVFMTKHKKNEERKSNDWIQGECDVDAIVKIQDYKTSETKDSFPMLPDEIQINGYDWQGAGYMMLWDRPKFELIFALVQTPDELIKDWEDYALHDVTEIEPELRLTILEFDRCKEKEALIKHKVNEARKYANWYLKQIEQKFE